VTTGIGAVTNTAKVQAGDNIIVFGLGGIGLNVLQAARMVGASKIIGVDINNDKKEWGERFGMTHFVNPNDIDGDIVAHLVALTDGGADYTFDCTGNTPKIVDWYMNGKIEIDPMITHVLKLENINEGFDLMHAGKSIRSVVVF